MHNRDPALCRAAAVGRTSLRRSRGRGVPSRSQLRAVEEHRRLGGRARRHLTELPRPLRQLGRAREAAARRNQSQSALLSTNRRCALTRKTLLASVFGHSNGRFGKRSTLEGAKESAEFVQNRKNKACHKKAQMP